jgi:hypothetical protein
MSDKYLQDISEIKMLMKKSSQFISLSGLAGILAGVYALIGAFIGHLLIVNHPTPLITLESLTFKLILLVAFIILLLSVGTALLFTYKKAKRESEKIWNATSKRMLLHFLIPLFTGGVFSILLLKNENYGLIAPVTLIFYGLSCVNASKYTFSDVLYLGITIIIIGLFSLAFVGYGLYFWALGFGVCHIIYGSLIYFRHDRN